jgi:hypothetical protein
MSRSFSQKKRKEVHVGLSTALGFIAFLSASQRWKFKSTTKQRVTNAISPCPCQKLSKGFTQKNTPKNPGASFPRFCVCVVMFRGGTTSATRYGRVSSSTAFDFIAFLSASWRWKFKSTTSKKCAANKQ